MVPKQSLTSKLFQDARKELTDTVSAAQRAGTEDAYDKALQSLFLLAEAYREIFQAQTASKIKAIIKKLEGAHCLSPEELRLVRQWIVGDADAYTRFENNFGDWTAEVNRLIFELTKNEESTLDPDPLFRIRALLIDLDRNLRDILNFLREKERIARFTKATETVDPHEGKILADMLSQKLNSPLV